MFPLTARKYNPGFYSFVESNELFLIFTGSNESFQVQPGLGTVHNLREEFYGTVGLFALLGLVYLGLFIFMITLFL